MRAIEGRIHNTIRWIAWLLVDYPREPLAWSEWTQWPAPASGIGAARTALHGLVFGLLLEAVLVWHYYTAADDLGYVGFLALPYSALPGFLAALRTRSIGSGAAAGALTAFTGSAIALVVTLALTRNAGLLINGSVLVLAAMIGWVLGAIGGIMALPCASLIARARRG